MNLHSDHIADLLDRVAALDDAPDRRRHEWFYVDLGQLMTDMIEDAVIRVAADEPELLHQPSYDRGHDDGYRSGYADGYELGVKAGRTGIRSHQAIVRRDGAAERSASGATPRGDRRTGETRIGTSDVNRRHRVHRHSDSGRGRSA